MPYEQGVIVLKPETLTRGLVGKVVSKVLQKGMRIEFMESVQLSEETAAEQYREYQTEGIKQNICFAMIKSPCIVILLSGYNATANMRKLIGKFQPEESEPGTVRYCFLRSLGEGSIMHASDNPWEAFEDSRRLCPRIHADMMRKVSLWKKSKSP